MKKKIWDEYCWEDHRTFADYTRGSEYNYGRKNYQRYFTGITRSLSFSVTRLSYRQISGKTGVEEIQLGRFNCSLGNVIGVWLQEIDNIRSNKNRQPTLCCRLTDPHVAGKGSKIEKLTGGGAGDENCPFRLIYLQSSSSKRYNSYRRQMIIICIKIHFHSLCVIVIV